MPAVRIPAWTWIAPLAGCAALRAARANRLQSSLNLALGSALASISLTIPAVAIVTLLARWNLVLGLDAKSTVLQGAVHLVIFAVYRVTTILPWPGLI